MEFVLILLIIALLCYILKVSLDYILLAVVALICLFSVFLALFFVCCFVLLATSSRRNGEFLRIDRPEGVRYKTAYYLVDGKEYPCIFPGESLPGRSLYQNGKIYRVLLNKKIKRVFDRFAITTCLLGLVFSIALIACLIFFYFSVQ